MRRIVLCIVLMVAPLLAQPKVDPLQFKKEAEGLEAAINSIATSLNASQIRPRARSTYLEGYGAVFMIEIPLEPQANPFATPPTAAGLQQNVARLQQEIREKVVDLLKKRFSEVKSVGEGGAISVAVNLLVYNANLVPNLPGQLLFTAKKYGPDVQVTVTPF